MTTRPRLRQTAIDGPDIRALAEFYRQLLGLDYRPGDEPPTDGSADDADWLVLRSSDGGMSLAFQLNPDLIPTTWPAHDVPMQLHIDMTVPDLESLTAARDHALALGGSLVLDRFDDPDEPLYVLADPAGHPFCVFVP